MYNWSTNTRELKKDKEAYAIWKIEQLVNFCLNREKLKAEELKKNWRKLRLDPLKKNYLKFLLWEKK